MQRAAIPTTVIPTIST